jgi:catechol 2,3-dioxygenase-like lactoylglutathione lyase family enzyme
MLTRRRFLVASGTAFAAFSLRAQEIDSVPTNLDHILLGCRDLDQGITFVESHTGVRAAFGGVHPGRGTQNALLSLGDRHYLEIIAPDPKQEMPQNRIRAAAPDLVTELKSLVNPRLVGWAAHPGSLADFAKQLRAAGIAFHGPTPGSRKRPDGSLLEWQTLNLDKDDARLLPFFIEWAAASPHPATDAPQGCRLVRFALVTPVPDALTKTVDLMSLGVTVTKGAKPQMRASITGPKGALDLAS